MGKYVLTNPTPLVTLKYNPYQVAFLQALAKRVCASCHVEWAYSYPDSAVCPSCQQPGTRAFHRFTLLAGRRGGKTRIGTLAVILEMATPGQIWYIAAPTYPDQERFVKPTFFKQLPKEWFDRGHWSATNHTFTAPNGSQVTFISLEDPEVGRGMGMHGIFIDEACKVSERAWDIVRPALTEYRGVAIFTSTPRGEDWVYERLYREAERGRPGFWACRYRTADNPIIDATELEEAKATMSPEMYRQEFEADIVTFTGSIYGDLLNRAVVDDETEAGLARLKTFLPEWPDIRRDRPSVIGLDPGADHPFAAVLLVSTPEGLVACGEYKRRELPAAQHAVNLKMLARGLPTRWAIDRSQAQMMIELAQHGIVATGAENDVLAGIERVKSWLLSGQLLIVKSRCPELLKELRSYRWADTERKDGQAGAQTPFKRHDDLCDALRYALMLWPHLPRAPKPPEGRDLTFTTLDARTRRDIERLQRFERGGEEAEDLQPLDEAVEGVGELFSWFA